MQAPRVRLRELRLERGMTFRDVARLSGIDLRAVWDLEHGEGTRRLRTYADKLLLALGDEVVALAQAEIVEEVRRSLPECVAPERVGELLVAGVAR